MEDLSSKCKLHMHKQTMINTLLELAICLEEAEAIGDESAVHVERPERNYLDKGRLHICQGEWLICNIRLMWKNGERKE